MADLHRRLQQGRKIRQLKEKTVKTGGLLRHRIYPKMINLIHQHRMRTAKSGREQNAQILPDHVPRQPPLRHIPTSLHAETFLSR